MGRANLERQDHVFRLEPVRFEVLRDLHVGLELRGGGWAGGQACPDAMEMN